MIWYTDIWPPVIYFYSLMLIQKFNKSWISKPAFSLIPFRYKNLYLFYHLFLSIKSSEKNRKAFNQNNLFLSKQEVTLDQRFLASLSGWNFARLHFPDDDTILLLLDIFKNNYFLSISIFCYSTFYKRKSKRRPW